MAKLKIEIDLTKKEIRALSGCDESEIVPLKYAKEYVIEKIERWVYREVEKAMKEKT